MFSEQTMIDLTKSLILMGQGMAGIFIGIILIMLIVLGLSKWTAEQSN